LHGEELHDTHSSPNIIYVGQIEQDEISAAYSVLLRESERKRPLGRSRHK